MTGRVLTKPHRILLLNPPGDQLYLRDYYCSHVSKARYYWHPYDLLVQSGILGEEYSVEALDAMVGRRSPQRTLHEILARNFNTLMVLSGSVSWRQDFDFVKKVVAHRQVRVIGTGDILVAEPERVMGAYPELEAILQDMTSPAILDYLAMCDGTGEYRFGDTIPDLTYRWGDRIVRAERKKVKNGTYRIPIPRYEIFPYRKYRIPHGRGGPFASILTDFGCPFTCTFCTSGTFGYKLRDIDNVMEEIHYARSLRIREMWVKDCTFGANRRHHAEFLEALIRENLGMKWVCLSRVDVLNEDMLDALKRAGCHTIQFGVESGDEGLLKSVRKGIRSDQTFKIFQACRKIGIRTLAHFIIGLPGETEESFRATLNLAFDLDPDFLAINLAMPRMGTEFRREVIESGALSDDVDVFDNSRARPVLKIGALSQDRVWAMRNQVLRRFHLRPKYLWRTYRNIRTIREFLNNAREGNSLLTSVRE